MWTFPYFLSVLSFFLAVLLISQLLRERRAPGSTVAWLLLMLFVPYLGVPLFLILGSRKLKRVRRRKRDLYSPVPYLNTPQATSPTERMLLASGARPKTGGNEFLPLESGEVAYRALLQALESAKESISISTFILSLDEVGRRILDVLEERAEAGVQVRVLLDGMGSFWTFRWRLRRFRKAGGKLAYFLPLVHVPFFGHSNLRNHRKLVIVDRRTAILGGMNLAREYMGPGETGHWVDLSFRVTGPVVVDLEAIFAQDWKFASGETLPEMPQEDTRLAGGESLQAVASGPDVSGDPLYDSIVSAIFDAKKRVWIATPYFIPDETLSKALELAAKRGVDVRLLVPRKSNHSLADFCRRSYLGQLARAGGLVFYYPKAASPGMMHAKALIVDDLYSVVGSANLDMRSLLLNFELGLFVYSVNGIAAVSSWFDGLFLRSQPGAFSTRGSSRMLDGLGRVLGPML